MNWWIIGPSGACAALLAVCGWQATTIGERTAERDAARGQVTQTSEICDELRAQDAKRAASSRAADQAYLESLPRDQTAAYGRGVEVGYATCRAELGS